MSSPVTDRPAGNQSEEGSRNRGSAFLTFLAWAVGGAAGTLATPTFSHGATASNLALLAFSGSDRIYNYDFNSQSLSSGNVDWTANMMFDDNAEIDKVKNLLQPEFDNTGNVKYADLRDYPDNYAWDSDRGIKNPAGGCPDNIHMRLYADGDDRMYNLSDGFYVFGTTHKDINEGCSGEEFGYSEDAEAAFVGEFRDRGYSVSEDSVYWSNYEAYREEGNHVWENNGNTSYVHIP